MIGEGYGAADDVGAFLQSLDDVERCFYFIFSDSAAKKKSHALKVCSLSFDRFDLPFAAFSWQAISLG